MGYARQVLEQAEILEDKYKGEGSGKKAVLCFDPALFICGKCICRPDQEIRSGKSMTSAFAKRRPMRSLKM